MFYLKRKRNFIPGKFSYGLWRETALSAHGMKSDEKPFYVKFMRFFEEKRYMLWLTGILYFWKFWNFSQPEAITDSPLNNVRSCHCQKKKKKVYLFDSALFPSHDWGVNFPWEISCPLITFPCFIEGYHFLWDRRVINYRKYLLFDD